MFRRMHPHKFAAVCCTALLLTACGGEAGTGTGGTSSAGPTGTPVAGGVLRALEISEPRNLDPAIIQNTSQGSAMVGNALYGTLMVSNEQTGKIEYRMAQDFSSTDGGKTFTLKLRPGLTFSDGTPLDAAAVKFNWDRIKDPALGSDSLPDASLVASTSVVDATTLKVTLARPAPFYGLQVLATAMNWIASPAALQKGTAAFDAHPVGAGPFTLKQWTHGGSIQLVKNTRYWDAPRPYLDGITLSTSADEQQRVNTLISGGVDLSIENSWLAVAKDKQAGLQVQSMPMAGGQFFALNTRRAPFNDPKVREAVSDAINLDTLNTAVFNGDAKVPQTLLPKTSPLFSDVPLHTYDKAKAQQLFDELAAAGHPVQFTFTAFPTTKPEAEEVQALLSAYRNVKVSVQVVDWAQTGKIFAGHDFDMVVAAANFIDPEPALYSAFASKSTRNATGLVDPALDKALDQGRFGTTDDARRQAYQTAAQRLAADNMSIFYTTASQTAVAAAKVGGIALYGSGSLLPDGLWLAK